VVAAVCADGSILIATDVGSFDLAATGTKGLAGKVTFDLAAQCRSFVEGTFTAGLAVRIAFVFGALGNARSAIAAVQRDKNRVVVIVAIRITVTVVVASMITVAVAFMITVAVVMTFMITVTVVMSAFVLVARAVDNDRAFFGSSATPADNTDNGKSSEHVHPVLHSSILQHLIW